MDAGAYRVEPLGPRDASKLAAVAAIYESAFPPSERKPPGFLADASKRPEYSVLTILAGERVAGMAVVYQPIGLGFCLIEYMAVAAEARGRRLGTTLFEAIARRNPDKALLVEVEADGSSRDEGDLVALRKAFYGRLGFREVMGVRYQMPAVSSEAPPPMNLLIFGTDAPRLRRTVLDSWLSDVFRNVYGIEEPSETLHRFLGDQPEYIPLI